MTLRAKAFMVSKAEGQCESRLLPSGGSEHSRELRADPLTLENIPGS